MNIILIIAIVAAAIDALINGDILALFKLATQTAGVAAIIWVAIGTVLFYLFFSRVIEMMVGNTCNNRILASHVSHI